MQGETNSLMQDIKVERISNNPLDHLKVGDFYWVKFDDEKWDGDKQVKVGEHETLMCIEVIGSNYVGFTIYNSKYSSDVRVHFDEFEATCRHEPNWRQILNDRMDSARLAIQEKTRELIREGQKACLIPNEVESSDHPQTLLPARVSVDPKKYKKELVRIQKSLPEISKEIEQLGEDLAVAAKNVSLPDLVKLNSIKEALGMVEDRIFTVELYCGLQETVKQIAKGEAAPIQTPIVIRQQMLFMDEETLFDYEDGGMDFEKIEKFDAWVVKPENLQRLLPDQRGIVAMRVRRDAKNYGHAPDLMTAWAHMQWAEANKQTYLLMRNGENVYRIASEVDFSPRLIPMKNEIGKDQFLKEESFWSKKDHEKVPEYVTQDSVAFDDHMKKAEALIRHYNRIVILIQGLLDRSQVFHPHVPINLRKYEDMEKWLVLIRDEELGLPNNKLNFEDYQKQVNSTLKVGKWIYIDSAYDENFPNGVNPNYAGRRFQEKGKRGWAVNAMPRLCRVDAIKKDGSEVQVSWVWGTRSTGKRVWVEAEDRPGWGHYKRDYSTDRLCHEWIPTNRVFNLSDYQPGDYKMFLCDRALQGKYLQWAKYLLTAEDWSRNRAKGIPPEQDKRAQTANR